MGRRAAQRWLRAACVAALLSLLLAAPLAAQPPGPSGAEYVVRPGDALPALAQKFGISLRTLMHLNGLRHPRDLYPGQRLVVGAGDPAGAGYRRTLRAGEDLPSICRAAGLVTADIAARNGYLLATRLAPGQDVWLPVNVPPVTLVRVTGSAAVAPRLAAAVASSTSWWAVKRLNPTAVPDGVPVLVPGDGATAVMGVPASQVTSLVLSQQPVARGQTVAFRLETRGPVACTVSAFETVEPCLPDDGEGRRWEGLVALSPMLEPGVYTFTLTLAEASGTVQPETVPVRLLVGAGRYDFERLDLPAGGAASADPQRSQAERDKIAALRLLRTPERLWSYPLLRPIDTQVSSYFGSRRSYGYGFDSFHAGTDFDGQMGMAVVAPADGVVILAEPLVVRGNAVLIDHGQGVVTGFWHLSRFDVAVGDRVSAGQTVAGLGNTGFSTGPHLHWELWVNGAPVDALAWLDPEGPGSLLSQESQ